MSGGAAGLLGASSDVGDGMGVDREIGRIVGREPGPTLVCVAGIHGNEPAGVLGARSILEALSGRVDQVRGEFVALAGNRAALAVGRRYLERDLNRAWTVERLEELERQARPAGAEDVEQLELLAALRAARDRARGPVHLIDLHTTSGFGGAFSTIGDTLENRRFALELPVPLILGLEEQVDGTLMDWAGRAGLVTLTFECGQHGEAESVDRARRALWIALVTAGVLEPGAAPEAPEAHSELGRESASIPSVLEVRYRHGIEPEDRFRMRPGYKNFQLIERGEILADDIHGPVAAPESARLLMPLYQEQGSDGFFVVRAFRPFWLRVSEILRRARAERWVHVLPGIARHPVEPDVLVVNRSVARWYALELLHLLGFRRHREEGRDLAVRRRGGS